MPNFDNAHVKQELERLEREFDEVVSDGYDAHVNELPDFYSKPYKLLTARQRGYIFGRTLKAWETKAS